MYRNVCFLVLLFLNCGLILAQPKGDNVKDYCTAAEGNVESNAKEANLCEDHHRNMRCQDLRRLICSCDDEFTSEGSGKQTRKTKDNEFFFYIFLAFHLLKGVIGAIGEIISTLFLILTWIFWFAQVIISAAFSVVFLLFV